jgi:hypothetical protein
MASAASSRVANPRTPELMKSRMRCTPAGLVRCVTSTMTSPHETTRSEPPSASMAVIPPREAPTSTGGRPSWSTTATQSAA